ncbi:hypothetical protein VTI74DRAFT_5640 [Chaetomium olivicolor]
MKAAARVHKNPCEELTQQTTHRLGERGLSPVPTTVGASDIPQGSTSDNPPSPERDTPQKPQSSHLIESWNTACPTTYTAAFPISIPPSSSSVPSRRARQTKARLSRVGAPLPLATLSPIRADFSVLFGSMDRASAEDHFLSCSLLGPRQQLLLWNGAAYGREICIVPAGGFLAVG